MGKKIVIVRPYGYYGGTLVLDVLCHLLREKGIDAKTFYIPYYPGKETNMMVFWKDWLKDIVKYIIYRFSYNYIKRRKFLFYINNKRRYDRTMTGLKIQFCPFIDKDNTIVVYPEVVYGNPLRGKNVVRWLMFFNRYQNDDNAFGKNDLFLCYRQLFNDWNLNPKGLEVKIIYFDRGIYKQYNFGRREGRCYILRKGRNRLDVPKEFDGPIIDDETEEDKVKILNRMKYCYSYDSQTFYMTIAAVCGCIPVIVLEPGKTKEDYLGTDERVGAFGIAYGDSSEEIEFAVSTRGLLLEKLDYSKQNEENINHFIVYVSERFGNLF